VNERHQSPDPLPLPSQGSPPAAKAPAAAPFSPDDPATRSRDPSGWLSAPSPLEAAGARRGQKIRHDEPPVLVIGPSRPEEKSVRPLGSADPAHRHLEAMVQDLLKKVRLAEDQLREKEAAITRLQEQTVNMARKLHAAGDLAGSSAQAATSDPVSLEALDFFSPVAGPRAAGPERPKMASPEKLARAARAAKSVRRYSQPAAPAPPRPGAHPQAVGGLCPACGHKLQKAKCVNVRTLVCLACRSVHLDARAVRQLGRTQSWFRFVERFLSSPVRSAGAAARLAKAPPGSKSPAH
jgi:hypothetical protein